MKRMFLVILCVGVIIAGGVTAYLYLDGREEADYSSGMFVDRGDSNGYATMYHLSTTL